MLAPFVCVRDPALRRVAFRWHTGLILAPDALDVLGEEQIELTIRHERARRRYSASVGVIAVWPTHTRTPIDPHGPPAFAVIASEPVRAFSAVHLRAFADHQLARILSGDEVPASAARFTARISAPPVFPTTAQWRADTEPEPDPLDPPDN